MAGQTIKYSLEHYRKSGVSEEAFMKWFQEHHLTHAVPLMKKYGITKYAVVSYSITLTHIAIQLTLKCNNSTIGMLNYAPHSKPSSTNRDPDG